MRTLACTSVCLCACTFMCVCIYVYVCVCMYVYMLVCAWTRVGGAGELPGFVAACCQRDARTMVRSAQKERGLVGLVGG